MLKNINYLWKAVTSTAINSNKQPLKRKKCLILFQIYSAKQNNMKRRMRTEQFKVKCVHLFIALCDGSNGDDTKTEFATDIPKAFKYV